MNLILIFVTIVFTLSVKCEESHETESRNYWGGGGGGSAHSEYSPPSVAMPSCGSLGVDKLYSAYNYPVPAESVVGITNLYTVCESTCSSNSAIHATFINASQQFPFACSGMQAIVAPYQTMIAMDKHLQPLTLYHQYTNIVCLNGNTIKMSAGVITSPSRCAGGFLLIIEIDLANSQYQCVTGGVNGQKTIYKLELYTGNCQSTCWLKSGNTVLSPPVNNLGAVIESWPEPEKPSYSPPPTPESKPSYQGWGKPQQSWAEPSWGKPQPPPPAPEKPSAPQPEMPIPEQYPGPMQTYPIAEKPVYVPVPEKPAPAYPAPQYGKPEYGPPPSKPEYGSPHQKPEYGPPAKPDYGPPPQQHYPEPQKPQYQPPPPPVYQPAPEKPQYQPPPQHYPEPQKPVYQPPPPPVYQPAPEKPQYPSQPSYPSPPQKPSYPSYAEPNYQYPQEGYQESYQEQQYPAQEHQSYPSQEQPQYPDVDAYPEVPQSSSGGKPYGIPGLSGPYQQG